MIQRWVIVGALFLLLGVCSAYGVEHQGIDCRREYKKLKKEGWKVKGDISLQQALERYYTMLLTEDDNHAPAYVVGKATGVGNTYSSALRVATANARRDLATNISVRVEALIETNVSSGTELIVNTQQWSAERLVEATAALTIYRMNKQNQTEVCTYILYPWERVVQMMDEAIETNN